MRIILGIIGVLSVLAFLIDRIWYKLHPGVEEKFADLDEKLMREEGR